MKKNILLIIVFLSLIFLVIISLKLRNYPTGKQNHVCFKNHCFSIELAVTPDEKNKGLMLRQNLDSDKGMLFILEREGKHSFWMKNTLIPLDIIWIDNNKEVVFINENTQPCRENSCPMIEPTKNAEYVLEINGGLSEKIGLTVGDKIYMEYSE